ncbi:haloacetate dehalogenase H-1 [Fusarium agapanthi]|uniref:Haloacetate dehalogenase H-1 n=1 Tax=Fusarium agapanthi TaxID=1803897 RepID=A0A9P5BF46_9HYPO|nr:haloacetate dehalogenase H-1 [Fusarium agapanthi]
MASDILKLLNHLSIKDPVHIHLSSGENAPFPETQVHEDAWRIHGVQHFHFCVHQVLDLPEALVSGREKIYLGQFYDK